MLRLVAEHPAWSNQQVADEVRHRILGSQTTAASVASIKSRAKPSRREKHAVPRPRNAGARYKSMAIGNAQNWVVRNLLGKIGSHSFARNDWDRVREVTFKGRCAYCGQGGSLEMDHAIPINIETLGEHHLGNLVPACKRCNAAKGDQHYAEYLASEPDRRTAIDRHMAQEGYVPLKHDGPERMLLREARREIGSIAEKYERLLNGLGSAAAADSEASDVNSPHQPSDAQTRRKD